MTGNAPCLLLAATLAVAAPLAAQEHQHDDAHRHGAAAATESPPPLYDNLGRLHRSVTTRSPRAQQYFDQGLRLTYGFNHAEAVRSFREATRLDPDCALCWWGIALALGPNINLPMEPAATEPAYQAAATAERLAAGASPVERALIEALAVRYTRQAPADRAGLDSAYARKMRAVYRAFSDDPDVGTFFAESMLLLRPWNQWTREGTPQPGTMEVVATLEHAIAGHPEHPGACHFYIHTVEASRNPERALPCARRLPGLVPGAGHLVHMPAHIYMRLGRYDEAVEANRNAVQADERYLAGPHLQSFYGMLYYPHNYHFLWSALSFAGRGDEAVAAARSVVRSLPPEALQEAPPVEFFSPTPFFALGRFQRWEQMLREPRPPADMAYTLGMWHHVRGLALAATGDLTGARAERDSLDAIRDRYPADAAIGLQPGVVLLRLATEVLDGEIAARAGYTDAAVAHLQEAIRIEDGLTYDEPPAWYLPVREVLGGVLLRAGRAADAETAFREDLTINRENGWALRGLAQALEAQGKAAEAARVRARFERAWSGGDS